ncbi:hypothetical protein RJT34_33167 [Clitoria ternatea]|uniref:DUF4005 domain-containing protein n=1 Tax=Clitoria ternatea TaxID=43366 RepID=A0AAN9EXB7_CLITE
MGKASRWFRGLLGLTKPDSTTQTPPKHKRRWTFVKSRSPKHNQSPPTSPQHHLHHHDNNNKQHAMAVAAATAAVAEAAVAAAEAAAAVVRLTSNSGRCTDAVPVRIRQHWAAIKIQAAFRGCLARRALRALKGLVKLQALVRGQIERRRRAVWFKKVQAVLHAGWTLQASSTTAKLPSHLYVPTTPEKFESPIRCKSMKYEHSPLHKRNGSKSCPPTNGNQEICGSRSLIRTYSSNDERNDRILEIDSGKPHLQSKRRNLFFSTSHSLGSDHYSKSLNSTSKESTSLQSGQSPCCEVEESPFCTADNSPQYLSATSKDEGLKRSPFTPTKSDGSRSYLGGYSDYPSYMAFTESSKAKVRSLSAPKQRPQYERSGSSQRYSLNAFDMSRMATNKASAAMHASFSNKAYPGSGRLDKLGMPVGYRY